MQSKSMDVWVVIGAFLVVILFVMCQPLLAEYMDPEQRFSLKPPEGWQVRALEDESGIAVFKAPDGVTSFMVLPLVAPESATLDDMPSKYEQLLKDAQPEISLKVLEETRVEISGQLALQREYIIERGAGERARMMATFIKMGDLSLTLAGTTLGEREFAKFKPVFQECIQTLRFAEAGRTLTPLLSPELKLAPEIQAKLNLLEQAYRAGILTDREYTIKKEGLEEQLRIAKPTLARSELTIKDGLMSLNVKDVPLFTILADIKKNYQIRINVTPSSNARAARVTTSFQNISIQEALARISPEDAIIDVVPMGEDIVVTGHQGRKKGERRRDTTGLFNKGEAPPAKELRVVKLPPTEKMVPMLEGKLRTKIPPTGPKAIGPIDKTPREEIKLKGIHIKLRLIMTAGTLEVASAAVIPGPLAGSPVVAGDHVYQVLLDERTLAVGTFDNPMIQRAYGPEGQVRASERASGTFAVDMPEIPLDLDAVEKLIIRVYSIPPGVQIKEMSTETIGAVQKQLKLLAETPEGAVAKVLVPKLKDYQHLR